MSAGLAAWTVIRHALPTLVSGLRVTLLVTAVAVAAGISWGAVLALCRVSGKRALSAFAAGYIALMRSMPLVLVLLWFFLIAPQALKAVLHLSPDADIRLACALVAFSAFESAYYAEIIRAGIHSVQHGQVDAALALGMSWWQTMHAIVLPQAWRAMTPLLLTQVIILFQDTSLVYVIGLDDFFSMSANIGARDGTTAVLVPFAGACYFIVCTAASMVVGFLRRRRAAV